MNKILLFQFTCFLFLVGCAEQTNENKVSKRNIDQTWLDSIIKTSDSSYVMQYSRTDFVTAAFYVNKKDSSLCQVMKDSAGNTRQIIIAKKGVRTFFAQYYSNGNLQVHLPLDEFGKHHGHATFYYQDGTVQSTGNFNHGFKAGQWKVYDDEGKLIATDSFDKNGLLVTPTHK